MPSQSETFHCPHCTVSLTKSAAASILGGAGGAWVGNLPASVTCPNCGGAIDTHKMIAGDYDTPAQAGALVTLLTLAALVAATLWVRNSTGLNFLLSALIVWGTACVLFVGVGWWLGRMRSLRR